MGCTKELDFATPPVTGAHLSFYWTMDEAGVVDKVDSTVGLHWPLFGGANGAPALISNGTNLPIVAFSPLGLRLVASPSIQSSTALGISFWFWIKANIAGTQAHHLDLTGFDNDPVTWSELIVNLTSSGVDLTHTVSDALPDVTTSLFPFGVGVWHMIACTMDLVNHTLNLYGDGVLFNSQPDFNPWHASTALSWLMGTTGVISIINCPDFTFDELGLCLDGVLTSTQITALYNGGSGKTWPNITPIVPYP